MVVVSVITTEGRFTVVIKLVSSPKSHLPACSRADSGLNFFFLTQTSNSKSTDRQCPHPAKHCTRLVLHGTPSSSESFDSPPIVCDPGPQESYHR
ncbi:hypothetical protein M405DRAFT_83487 [Rhizopogon salebrosus TDB-379]|nr:hypothetical protein M405DRAFT_83487 [Rhizopogon salebrosus TDB-379]